MRKILVLFLVGVLAAAFAAPAFAWEFSMKGEFEHRFRYIGRLGDDDLFGKASLQDSPAVGTFIGFAGPSIYGTGYTQHGPSDSAASGPSLVGGLLSSGTPVIVTRGGFSRWGSDALWHDTRMVLRPVIRVNKAVRVFGAYALGGIRNKYAQYDTSLLGLRDSIGTPPFEDWYQHRVSMNAYDTAAIGSWRMVRSTIQNPWGVFSIGIKDFPLGTGATLGYNTRANTFLTVVPYGPFRFLHAIWFVRGRLNESWNTQPDADQKARFFQGLIMTFENGPINLGGGAISRMYHGNAGNTPPFGRDIDTLINLWYAKFNNGVFFANAEYAWLNINQSILGAGEVHVEANHFFSEAGAVMGPAKISLMYALASGPVLNNPNQTKAYVAWPINYQAMEPYEYLMFNVYGGGNQTYDGLFVTDGHGMMGDAYAFAGRLDYAVAANLNVYGSWIWAHRLEKAGFLNGGVNETGGGFAPGTFLAAQIGGTPGVDAQLFCPDGFIGWEANVGADWKLLEGMILKMRYSLWQPGEWFRYAYQAYVPMTAVPGQDFNVGMLRDRDPINAFTGSILIDF